MDSEHTARRQRQQEIGDFNPVEHVRIDNNDCHNLPARSVVETEVFGLTSELVERLAGRRFLSVAVGEQINQTDPAVCANHSEGQRTKVELLDQMWPTDVQHLGCLDRCEFRVHRYH